MHDVARARASQVRLERRAVSSRLSPVSTPGELSASPALEFGGRALDVAGALALLVALLPFLTVIALAVKLTSPGPVLFAQRRVGRGGRWFSCWKFRTMVTDAEERLTELLSHDAAARQEWARDHKLRRDPRVTAIGVFLRKSSLDELPQLFNVLGGTMSLVGPRPIELAECSRYGRYLGHYCAVRPGITGLWQISGRNDTSYRRRIAFDVVYARRRSLALDAKILAVTVPRVMMQKGAY